MGPGYPDRFMELFAMLGEPATVVNGAIFKLYSGMVVPFGPADADYSLSPEEASRALRSLGGMLLRTTGGFRPAGEASEWYAVICRAFTPIESVGSANTRSKLSAGCATAKPGRSRARSWRDRATRPIGGRSKGTVARTCPNHRPRGGRG